MDQENSWMNPQGGWHSEHDALCHMLRKLRKDHKTSYWLPGVMTEKEIQTAVDADNDMSAEGRISFEPDGDGGYDFMWNTQ